MAYVDISTLMTIATGQPLPAAVVQQIRDNDEFLIDPPACSIKETTPLSVAHNTPALLTSNEENYDNDSMHSTASNTSRITVQTAGRYEVGAVVEFAADVDGVRTLKFLVDGTTYYEVSRMGAAPVAATVMSFSRTLVLSASSYVEVEASHTAGNNLDVTLHEFYMIFRTR